MILHVKKDQIQDVKYILDLKEWLTETQWLFSRVSRTFQVPLRLFAVSLLTSFSFLCIKIEGYFIADKGR